MHFGANYIEPAAHSQKTNHTFPPEFLIYLGSKVLLFKKHIGPKAGSCAFSCNHPRPNMADQNCNLGNDPASKPLPLTSFKSITYGGYCLHFAKIKFITVMFSLLRHIASLTLRLIHC